MATQRTHRSAGFTLIEVAIGITIGSLILVGFLNVTKIRMVKEQMETTKSRMIDIKVALGKFQVKHNGRLPCPAWMNDDPTSATFGHESLDATSSTCLAAGGAVEVPGTGSTVMIGAVPVADLELSQEHMIDYWGQRYMYAASKNLATAVPPPVDPSNGSITLQDAAGNPMGPSPNHTPYVLFSVGKNGKGSTTLQGQNNPRPCPPAGTGPENINCSMTSGTFISANYSTSGTLATNFSDIMANTLIDTTNNPEIVCGNLGMMYGPGHNAGAGVTADKCIPNLVIANNGNVGIGTAAPTLPLAVFGNDGLGWTASFGNTTNGMIGLGAGGAGTTFPMMGAYNNALAPTSLVMQPAGGNIGIGALSPTYRLGVGSEINPGFPADPPFNVSNSGDIIVNGGADTNWALYYPSAATNVLGLTPSATPGLSNFSISNARVGIGTPTPSTPLHVQGVVDLGNPGDNANYTALIDPVGALGTGGLGIGMLKSGTGAAIQAFNNAPLVLEPNTGNVGIGSMTPAEKLEVVGNIAVTINGVRFKTELVNNGIKSSSWQGRYGGYTGYTDTCDGSFSGYTCPFGTPYTGTTCFDINGSQGGGGNYYNITCNAALIFKQQ